MYTQPTEKTNRIKPYSSALSLLPGIRLKVHNLQNQIPDHPSFITLTDRNEGIINSLTSKIKLTHFSLNPLKITQIEQSASINPPPTKGIYDPKNKNYILWGGLTSFNLLCVSPKIQIFPLELEPATHLTKNTDDDPSHPIIHLKVAHSLLQISRPMIHHKKGCLSSTYVAETPKETQISMNNPKFKGGNWAVKIAQEKIVFLTDHGTLEWALMNGEFGGHFKIKDSLKKSGVRKGWKILDLKPVCDFNGVMIAIEGEDKIKVLRNWIFFYAFGIGAASNTMFLKDFMCLKNEDDKEFYGEFGAWEVERTNIPELPYAVFLNEALKPHQSRVWVIFVEQRTSKLKKLGPPIEDFLENNESLYAMCFNQETNSLVGITKDCQLMSLSLDSEIIVKEIVEDKTIVLNKKSFHNDKTVDDSRWDFNDRGSEGVSIKDINDSSLEGSEVEGNKKEFYSESPSPVKKKNRVKKKSRILSKRGQTVVGKFQKKNKQILNSKNLNRTIGNVHVSTEKDLDSPDVRKKGDKWELPNSNVKNSQKINNFKINGSKSNKGNILEEIDQDISINSVEESEKEEESVSISENSISQSEPSEESEQEKSESASERESVQSSQESEREESEPEPSEQESEREESELEPSESEKEESQESEPEPSESENEESQESEPEPSESEPEPSESEEESDLKSEDITFSGDDDEED